MLRDSQDLWPGFSHQDRMLKLCRQSAVLSPNGPPIVAITNRIRCSAIDHRLDCKTHPRVQPFSMRLWTGHVGNIWSLVKLGSDPVTDIFVDDSKTIILFDMFDDRLANHGDPATRTGCVNSNVKAVERALRDISGLITDLLVLTYQKRLRLVTMPTVHNRCQINVGDITWFEFIVPGNAMTDHVIDTNATTFWKGTFLTRVIQASRNMSMVERVLVNDSIKFTRRHPGFDMGTDDVHQVCVESAGRPHHFAFFFN